MGQLAFVIVFLIFSWSNLFMVVRSLGIVLPPWHHWLTILFSYGSAPISAVMAVIAWYHVRSWRRMEELRDLPVQGPGQNLARGAHCVAFVLRGPAFLERWTLRLFGLALLASWLWYPGVYGTWFWRW